MNAFKTMQKHYQQRDLAAKEWKKKGGKVVGYYCDNVPEELIIAAGCFPLRISGDPRENTEEVDKYLEPFDEGFVRTSVNMILTGKYDFIDYLIIPRARTSVSKLWAHLAQIQALEPKIKFPVFYTLDYVNRRSYASKAFNFDRIRDFKKKLEEWTGKKTTKASLLRAIDITNENKMLLKKVAAFRAAEPPRLSGVEALQIIGSSMFMLKEEHNKLLKEFLEKADTFPTRDGARLFVEGSPLDNLQFYELVESNGATIVAEDNCWGNRYSDVPVESAKDPLEAIATRYFNKSPCPYVLFPEGLREEYLLQKSTEAKAQGVVFYVLESDCYLWDYLDHIKMLKEKGIPAVLFKEQKYLISEPEPLKTGIDKFAKSIKGN